MKKQKHEAALVNTRMNTEIKAAVLLGWPLCVKNWSSHSGAREKLSSLPTELAEQADISTFPALLISNEYHG